MGNKLSVVIHSHQPTLILGRCLDALMEQKCADEIEVVVVDHRPRRSVHQLIRWWNLSLARQGRRARILHLPLRGATTEADRLAVRACSGSMVAFLDDSSRPARDWAANAIAELEIREAQPLDITPPLQSQGVAQRRSAVMSALSIDDRAVLSAHAATADFFPLRAEPRASSVLPGQQNRVATVTPIERSARARSARVEDAVCLTALIVAIAAVILQSFAIALFAGTIWIALTAFASRGRSRRNVRDAFARPITNVRRGMLMMRSPR
jgi:hypothetical protein